jgi:hypothetical protein
MFVKEKMFTLSDNVDATLVFSDTLVPRREFINLPDTRSLDSA